jgi:hypothetical protein
MLFEKILAALILLICVLALWRGALGAQRHQQWDARVQRALGASRRAGHTLAQRWQAWRSRRHATQAAQEANAVIERARRAGSNGKKSKQKPNENNIDNDSGKRSEKGSGQGSSKVIYPAAFDPEKRRGDKLH